ncbi:hypothetical protein [Endozoicomonas sp. YOMI1]|uniref:hypothetical protein n=1 Tax=Endozoicomonas sp. YOMI1 TaxID=2828739 RepID=UPI0021497FA7|nr:hypothetical protein [Endozoicomonas sp. YOMI1]
MYSAIRAFTDSVARNVELASENFVQHLDVHLGERISKRISEWKVSIPLAIPVSQEMFDFTTGPHLENSPRARELSQYLNSLLKEMTHKGITPEQSLTKISELNDLTQAFADEASGLPESWYRYDPQPDRGLPILSSPGYPRNDPRHNPEEDFCLRELRLGYAQIMHQQIVNSVRTIFKRMSDLSLPFNQTNSDRTGEDESRCVINFREHWLNNKILCEELINDQHQDITAGIESLDFNKRMFLMV